MQERKPNIRFIKLGDGGKWEKKCIHELNIIRLGYENPFHEESLRGEWEPVRDYWLERRRGERATASRDLNQIRDFYEQPEETIWITFRSGLMYWCNAYTEVTERKDDSAPGAREREVIGQWSCHDLKGKLLSTDTIDGRVTQVQGYRGTICSVNEQDYLLGKIAGEPQPEIIDINQSLYVLEAQIEGLIKGLWWHDFELLVDLIFSKLGWQRVSVLGKTGKDLDLDLISPVTGERAFVQIKSTTSSDQLKTYIDKFNDGYDHYDHFYFVFHTVKGEKDLLNYQTREIRLWDSSILAKLVIKAGLVDWLIVKRS